MRQIRIFGNCSFVAFSSLNSRNQRDLFCLQRCLFRRASPELKPERSARTWGRQSLLSLSSPLAANPISRSNVPAPSFFLFLPPLFVVVPPSHSHAIPPASPPVESPPARGISTVRRDFGLGNFCS